jgi:hypothetical protein
MANYRDELNVLFDRQDEKGLSKYGYPLEQSNAEISERLNHLAEELVDGLRYVLWIQDALCQVKSCKRCYNSCKSVGGLLGCRVEGCDSSKSLFTPKVVD